MTTNKTDLPYSITEFLSTFGLVAPVFPRIPEARIAEFLQAAPESTVIIFNNELYRRVDSEVDSEWMALEELDVGGPSYMTYDTWAKYSPNDLSWIGSDYTPVYLVSVPSNSVEEA